MDTRRDELPSWLGRFVTVRVEAPRGRFVKRDTAGRVDLVSPLPVPFDYGCVPGTTSGDGDPVDALILGGPFPEGMVATFPVWGVVDFMDAGAEDPKLVCGPRPRLADQLAVEAFFAVYARYKRGLGRLRGQRAATGVRRVFWKA